MNNSHKKKKKKSAGKCTRLIALRIDRWELEKLDQYCGRRGWTRSRAIREFISMIVD